MTDVGLNIPTMRKDIQTDRFLLMEQVRENKATPHPFQWLKFLLASSHLESFREHIWFCPETQSKCFANPKATLFSQRTQKLFIYLPIFDKSIKQR